MSRGRTRPMHAGAPGASNRRRRQKDALARLEKQALPSASMPLRELERREAARAVELASLRRAVGATS